MRGSQKDQKRSQRSKAQSATELAIFGAVLMFILGIMVRQAHNANLSQAQSYRAMRLALTKSYLSSLAVNPSRNNATVLIVEDRLNPGSEKYGPTSRFPLIISGNGSMSSQFMQPQTYGQDDELPRLDMYINGVFFPFTVAGYKQLVGLNTSGGSPEWDAQCAYRSVYQGTNTLSTQWLGCTRFYRIVPNYIQDKAKNLFCCDDVPSCSQQNSLPAYDCSAASNRCCNVTNLNVERRFDLNRDPGNNPPEETALTCGSGACQLLRANFAWQWYLVKGFDPTQSTDTDTVYNGTNWVSVKAPYHTNYGDALVVYSDPDESSKNKNTLLDVDHDFKEEVALGGSYTGSGVLSSLNLIDYQQGDIDTSYDKLSAGPEPGMKDDLQMFSFTDDGTLLQLQEGKLYSPSTKQFVRSTQKRNRIDIIQRIIQLSNNTGRFCTGAAVNPNVDGGPNPVEVCSDNCFSTANVDKTCYNIVANVIYVRSRVKDVGGRRWVTQVP